MKIKFLRVIICLIFVCFKVFPSFGQLTGIKSIPGDYASISSAVTALNTLGVGAGGVTFNIAANYNETISATISLTATGTVANPILFQKDPSTTGANPLITGYTTGVGTPATAVQDGIWRLVGSDYVTINGIDVKDNPANTTNPSTMEYGYALYKASTANGCQFVTIENCTISLNNINNATGTIPMTDGSAGIIVMNATPAAANVVLTPVAGGTNSNNKFYGNTIENCNIGISIIGYSAASPFTLADTNNDIGGSSLATGNTIINYGGAAAAANPAAAIRTLAQYGLNASYNTINNNNGSGANHPGILRGIYSNTATSASTTIIYNTITLNGGGTTQNISGIENVSGSTPASNTVNISNNTITNSTYTTATTGGFYGIFNNAASPATLTLNNNIVSNNSSSATTTGFFYGITNSGAATTVTMSGNSFTGNTTATLTTGLFAGIYNSGVASGLTIANNTLSGNSTTAVTGVYYPIYNTAAVTATININSNNIGTSLSNAITFNAANSGAQICIANTGGAATAALSISNNNIQGINYAVPGTGANTYISNTAATLSQAINNNTFTNLTVNTTGSITFISNSVAVSATGTQNVNGNSIVTAFNKAGAGGTVTLFTSAATCLAGSVINNNNNNFSNITVAGATVIAGWVNTDAGASTKTIQNNTFSNWTGGTGAITAMSVSLTGTNNATTGNAINNISSAGTITGIATAAGNDNIYSNAIYNLVSSGTLLTTVNGISVTAGTTKNIYQNTISNLKGNTLTTGTVRGIVISGGTTINLYQNSIDTLQGNSVTSGSVNGISVAGGTTINAYQNTIYSLQGNSLTTGTVNGMSVSAGSTIVLQRNKVYDLSCSGSAISSGTLNGILVSGAIANMNTTIRNNLVGDLRAPSANVADPVIGINLSSSGLTSTNNVYNNTIYLNGTSGGTNFGSTGIYQVASATATTAKLDLRNNIVTNISTPNGTGLSVAFRRSAATLGNYASTSNNNLFYAGASGASRLIYYDGTNLDQVLTTFKTRVTPADALSVTEDLITGSNFLSTTGSSSSFLHIDSSKTTQVESGGANIAGVTDDYDGNIREGNTGYSGTGTAPDIGADEFEGTKLTGLSGTYNVGTGEVFTSLTNAGGLFAAINTLGLAGNVIINITSDLAEDGTNSLYQWTEQGSGNYTLIIQPDGSTLRTISGNVLAGMIRFTGADRVTIDGSSAGIGTYLTFRNTNTAGTTGTAFTFINGATNNTIKYCNMEAYANATNGVVLFSTSTIAGGNSNNLISYCNIDATVSGNTGNVCVYSAGTVGNENSTNTISNNNIFNYRDRGLDISATGSLSWAINNNSFYNGTVTGSINYAASYLLHGIRIAGGGGYSIVNNYIGGSSTLASGSNAAYSSTLGNLVFYGIQVTAATGTSNIKGNVIRGITVSSVPSAASANEFVGIETIGAGIINVGGISAGDGNMIGSNTTNGSVIINTNTALVTNTSFIRGINYTSTNAGSVVIGNQVGGFDINNIGTTVAKAAPSTFQGIVINAATAPAQVNSNIIGSTGTGAALNSIRVIAASTANATSLTGLYLSPSVASTVQVNANIIQNISQQVTTVTSGSFFGISVSAIAGANITVTNNDIKNNSVAPTTAAFYGIYNSANPTSITISSDTISNNTNTAGTTGLLYGIFTTGTPSAVTINNNTFSGNTTAALTTGVFAGVYNTATPATLNINNNSFYGNATTSISGAYYPIYQAGAVTTAININSNSIGTSTSNAITYNAANSGAQVFIDNTAGTAACALSISNNNFYNVVYAVAGSGANTYISNTATTLSQAINGNTFTNLSVNTTGSITFIANSVIVSATGTQNVNNNAISGTFVKSGIGGTVTLFTSAATSVSGSITTNSNNNFSNITVSGATIIAGWINTDAGASTKNIQNNTFSNWAGGTGAITALAVNLTESNNATSGNLINTISSAGAITGITTAAGNDNIYSNTVNTLSTTGAAAVTGIAATAGTSKNIYKNKIYDISGSNAGSTVNGILVSGGIAVNVYNNLVGDLRATAATSATDVIRGISVTSATVSSAVNVYFNTVYLNASSSGATFGTSGIYHLVSATATTASLTLRNNSINNTSTPKGAGITAAFRRSGTALNNYGAASNNNLFFAGTAAATKLLFYDGTNSDQTLATYKTRVSPRDALSVTEDLTTKFLSTSGASSVFLHMNSSISTQIESGAANISGFTDDFDGQVRAGNPGYTGSSSSPDIGADEIFGVETTPPTITYTLLTNTTSTANRSVTGVTITDASGVNVAAGTKPRIYYKRSNDANVWLDNSSSTNGWKYTEATNSTSPFTFTIDYSLLYGGASVTAGTIQYFIIAQDIATTANIAINSGTFALAPSSVALTSTAFPIGGTINSYNIPFSGTYNVGNTEIFTSLTKADGLFAAINNAGLMGNTTFNITSDLAEDGTNALNQWTESGVGNYTLTIQPDAATVRTISGNVPAGLIRLNGADRVTIDGRNGGTGSYLSFKNTNAAGTTGTAFTFINGATNNTIKYCDAEAYTNATNGVILFGTTASVGNSNNVIDNCTINGTVASNTGNVDIYSGGTVGNENSSNTISNNSMYGYRDRGLDVSASGSTTWVISGNNLYNGDIAGTINYAASSTLHGIRISGGSGYSILNNYIGGSAASASGTNAVYASTSGNVSYQGILLTTTSASPVSNIKGNTIAAISLSSIPTSAASIAFIGIETNGSGINIGGSVAGEGNQIGSAGNNGSVIVTTSTTSTANTSLIKGINCASTGGSIIGNQVAGIDINNIGTAPASSSFTGLYINSATPPSQAINNIIGSGSISNSIRVLSTSSATITSLCGIALGSLVNSDILLSANTIENVSHLSSTSSGNFTGISNGATSGVCTISNDTVQNITTAASTNSGSTTYTGISSSSASSITNNLINNVTLSSSGTNAQITGINVSGAFAHTISGNFISGLSTESARVSASVETSTPAGSAVIGILNSATVGGQVISGNTLYNFNATNTSAVNTVVTGIGITATVSGNIFNNRIAAFKNNSTGSGPGICGVVSFNGSFNLYNNSIRLKNSGNVNGVKIYGIIHAAGNNWNYFYNTVSVGGNSTGTSLRSAGFIRPVAGSLYLRDNVFVNTRTGNGQNYAISNLVAPPNSGWASTASDYNDLFSSDASKIGEWGLSTDKTFAQWQAASGGDANSVSRSVGFITSLYDLQPDSSSNCSISNAGTPITSPIVINADINNASRGSVSPDMGAYEFNYLAFTIAAGNNSPVCAGDSITLSVNAGAALNPTFSWTNPGNTVISTVQNPTLVIAGGQYKVSVTDVSGCSATDSTIVLVNLRPTAHITSVSQSAVCDSGYVNLNISVTGTGIISGTLSNGDSFSGNAPLITVPVFAIVTTSYSISSLSDTTCTALPTDIPDTVTVIVTHQGNWLGVTTNWHDPANWCGGILPTSTTDVIIPAGTPKMPTITDSAYCNNLLISPGDSLTITGTGTLNIAGLLTNNGIYTDNGTTNFNGTSGQQTFSGVTTFNNVLLNNVSGLLLPAATTIKNNLSISAGVLNANNLNITVGNNWINNVSTAAFTSGTGSVLFNGTGPQLITGSFATSFNNLTISGSNVVTAAVNAGINGNLLISSGTFDLGIYTANRVSAGGTLTVSGGATLKIGGPNTLPSNYSTHSIAANGTIEYNGTNQSVATLNSAQVYGNLTISGSGTKTLAGAENIAGNLTISAGTLDLGANIMNRTTAGGVLTVANGAALVIGGTNTLPSNFSTHLIGTTSTIEYSGTNQVLAVLNSAQDYGNLKVSGSGTKTLSGNVNYVAQLNFSGATITTGTYIIYQKPSGSVGLTTGYVIGNFKKYIAAGATSKTFEIGDALNYTPVTLVFAGLTTGGDLTASVTATDHPNLAGSGIRTDKSVNRYWTLTNSGIAFANATITMNWVAGDIDAGSNTSNFKVGNYSNPTWSLPSVASPLVTSIQATGLTSLGDFAVGESCSLSSGFSYTGSPYCSNGGTATPTVTGTAGTFSSTAGLSVDTATGIINLATSTPGTYTVTNMPTSAGGCTSSSTTTITITAAPSATISYTGSPYCSSAGTASVTFTGTTGGTYSSTPGLSIDPVTGAVILGTSTPGTYTVTYTVAAAGGCSLFSDTTSVTVSAPLSATISYTGSPYCSSAGTATVTRTGASGGTYTSTAGLSINSITGDITLSASTPGTYIVTYTMINGGCTTTTNTSVTITAAPSAVISYDGSPYCSGAGTATATRTGTPGGIYSSTTGLALDTTTGDINLSTSIPGTYIVTYTVTASGGCSQYQTTAAVTVVIPGTWSGATSTDWNASGNWVCGAIPTATTNVIIPSGLRNNPILNSGIGSVQNITIQNGASLTVTNVTLQIAGNISNSGTFDAGNGTIEMNGAASQTIAANTFQNNAVNNLMISNTSSGGVILGGALDIYGSLTYSDTGMKLTTNDSLTLKSTALNTASVGDMTGNTITGKVTVERYISARKAWRLLSIPTNTTQTIQQTWQEGCGANANCIPGFGTQITGAGGTAAGFDVYTATPSMKTYVPATNTWAGVPTTNATNIKNINGYVVFIRGDRGATTVNAVPTQTILRTRGSLYTGDQAPVPVLAGKFASIGNPYASSLDMRYITKTGLKNFFYVWDPNLGSSSGYGGYQTLSYNGSDYVITPGMGSYSAPGSVSNYIQSGQAFLVQADSIGNGSLTFKEDAKSSGSAQVSVVAGSTQPQLRISLYGVNADNSTYMIDGALINYDDGYSNRVDDMDAIKSANTSENLSIKTGNALLVIERRRTISNQDTTFLNLTGTKIQKYRFQFKADQLDQQVLTAFLEDNYLHTSAPINLSGSTNVDFNIANIPASYAPDRFRIVFKQFSTLPVTFTSVKAYQQNKDIAVEWKVENETNLEQYSVEKSVDGNHYTTVNTVAANNATHNYNWLDVNPSEGYNYYRVVSTDLNGKTAYSTIVKVFMGTGKQAISIYPNPVVNGTINLQLTNQPAGTYGVRLLNTMGQVMIAKQITHAEGSSTESMDISRYAPFGIYQLEVTSPDMKTTIINLVYKQQ